ncbi:MAG TPA: hypothetical protein DHW22_12130, partial [Planctomycetaceae bacterium]|nr:hypothetical protein [Planctomycetaceae bacterium]
RLPLAIAGRLLMGQHLLQRVPADVIFAASGVLAQLASQYPTADFGPLLHVSIHSCTFLKIRKLRA